MKAWIARDEEGTLMLFDEKPNRISANGMTYWEAIYECLTLDFRLFPEVTFENSPQEVEIKLVKK